jgi:Kef-type K+ transport system membrane component KefB
MHLHPEALFIIQSLILICVPYALWQFGIIKKFIPLVVVQILIGIALGPSVLGQLNPDAYHALFPKESLPILNGLAWMALILFGFSTGLHFDIKEIASRGLSFLGISISTVAVPAVIGGAVAAVMYNPAFAGPKANQTTFVLGMAIAIGVTALPVLGAILSEMGLMKKEVGKKTLGYATMNDLLLWLLVSILIALANSGAEGGDHGSDGGMIKVLTTIGLTVLYLGVMFFSVRPLMEWLADKKKFLTAHPDFKQLVFLMFAVLLSSLATELIGIHYLLGAFIFGAMLPKSITEGIHHSLETFLGVILLPFFFMLTGLKTLFKFDDMLIWQLFIVASVVASVGKILGTTIPELMIGTKLKQALQAGALMQTKGLMEVVVLNIMLTGGIISATTFSAMILMAVVTTALTKPSLMLVSALVKGKDE